MVNILDVFKEGKRLSVNSAEAKVNGGDLSPEQVEKLVTEVGVPAEDLEETRRDAETCLTANT